jgi:Dolichyl-phosphate-mannose-protein mannosyltransferase
MPSSGPDRRIEVLTVLALTVTALLPFLAKPFHLDDPVFLWTAAQILRHPFDPFGVLVNWYGIEQPLSQLFMNPPLTSYGIAAVSQLVGPDERTLHTAFLVPAATATVGTWYLAARLGAAPTVSALAVLCSPVFLTSATSVMCDVPMLACFVWAVFFWIRGLEDQRTGSLFLAGSLAAAAALAKYFGLALVPLLALFALWRERRAGVWCVALLLPIVVMGAYQWGTDELYGRGLLASVADYAVSTRAATREAGLVGAGLVGLAFTGACAATLLFFLPVLVPSWRWLVGGFAGVCALAAGLSALGSLDGHPLRTGESVRLGLVLQIALHVLVGLAALGLAGADFARRRSAGAALLLVWVLGTFVFAAFVNWTTNARSLLPLMPALGILIGRRLSGCGTHHWARFVPLAPALALALVVASEDQQMAESAKRAADTVRARYGDHPGTVWFQGHWGFQYYMEAYGFRALDRSRLQANAGDLIVRPRYNTNLFAMNERRLRPVGSFVEPPRFVAVMDLDAGAGFYSSLSGPLPYVFGGAKPARYSIDEVTPPRPFRPRGPSDP